MVARLKSNSWPAALLVAALMLATAPNAMAHDESIPCTLDLVVYPDHAQAELRFPILTLLAADAWADKTHPNMVVQPVDIANIDRDAYVKSKADQMIQGMMIAFDGTTLTPKLIKSSADDLVLFASEEDTEARPVAIYQIEYSLPHPQPPVKLVTLQHELLPPPNDGSNVQVVCLVNRKQNDRKGPYPIYIANDDRMIMKCDWTPLATTAPSSAPAGRFASAGAVAPAETHAAPSSAGPVARGNRVAVYAIAAVAVISAAVLAWAKLSRR
jgi:hypothetical protein